MSVWSFFDRVTSLTVDPAEWEKGCAEFARVGLENVIRYQALPIDPETECKGPHQSFNLTARKVLQDFADSDAKTLLFLEDDCTFREMGHLESALRELPSAWDLCYLGCNIQDPSPTRYSKHLWKLNAAWTTHAIGFSRRPIQFILDNQPAPSEQMLDNWISGQLVRMNAFVISPMICWQRPHWSGIWQQETNYDEVFTVSQQKLDSDAPWIAPAKITVQYILDSDVDAALDLEIRNLLCECFGEGLFRTQRYATEKPAHRWLVRADDGKLIGHVAAHKKTIIIDNWAIPILGIAEACVHPDHRRGGKLRQMMTAVHEWATDKDFAYSVLFGHAIMYASSGYMPALNLWNASETENYAEVMVKALGDAPWPHEKRVYLQGPRF